MPIKGCHLEEGIDLSSEVVPGYELDLNEPMMPKHKPAHTLVYTRPSPMVVESLWTATSIEDMKAMRYYVLDISDMNIFEPGTISSQAKFMSVDLQL